MDNFLKCGELESYGLKEIMASLLLSPVPERPISANTGLKFCSIFVLILPSYVLLRVTFCAIITASRRKGSTIFYKLKLHVLR